MEELSPIGLVVDEQIKISYMDKFNIFLASDKNIEVYISKKHGGGAGKYKISNIDVNGQKIVLSLDFKRDMFEAGASVINQRILFFKVEPNCKIIKIKVSNEG